MILKKVLFVLSILLSLGAISACNSDSDITETKELLPGDSLVLYADGYGVTKAVYQPISYQNAPEWLQAIIDEKGKGNFELRVFQGEMEGDVFYLKWDDYYSSIGTFLDKNGERLSLEGKNSYSEFFAGTSNWKLIYYYSNF